MAAQNIMTESEYRRIQETLDDLIANKRQEIIAQIEEARSHGDLSENAEYDEARKDQAKNEAEIARLENLLKTAEVVRDEDVRTDRVAIGTVVTVRNRTKKKDAVYTIVNSEEVDPLNNMISTDSPIGKALMGAAVGDRRIVETPRGTLELEVKKIGRRA